MKIVFAVIAALLNAHVAYAGSMTLLGAGKPPTAAATTLTLDPARKGANQTLSNGNLTTTLSTNTFYSSTLATGSGRSTGKYYYEVTINALNGDGQGVGVGNLSANLSSFVGSGDGNSIGFIYNGLVLLNNTPITTIQTFAAGNTVGIATDLSAKLIWFRTDAGNWNNSGTANPATGTGGISFSGINAGPYVPMIGVEIMNDQFTTNFGATSYANTPPSGFGNW